MAMVGGLTPERARAQWEEIAAVQERVPGIRILRSCEVDILRDGSLDLPDEILAELIIADRFQEAMAGELSVLP